MDMTQMGSNFSSGYYKLSFKALQISLEQKLTIKSHDSGKEGHFCKSHPTSPGNLTRFPYRQIQIVRQFKFRGTEIASGFR